MRRTFIASAFAGAVNAWWVDPAPQQTNAIAMKELGDAQGWTPIPTTAPVHRDMIRRQAATQILGYLAPDNTCGYVAGRLGGVKTCATSDNCAAILGTDEFYTMGCCGAGACTMQGACYDYSSMASCDQACLQDANIVKCSGTSYPYCYPYSVPGMNMGFYSCDSVTTSAFQVFETTYNGETPTATWLALRSSDFDALLDSATSTFDLGTTSRGRTLTPTSDDNSASTTTSTRGPGSTTPVPPPAEKKSTPVGAIVGGVVGGLAALGAFIGLLIFFLFKKKKAQKAAAADPNNPPAMAYNNTAPPPPNGGNNGYFAPVAAAGNNGKYEYNNVQPKYDGTTVQETPVSPAPAYAASAQQHQNNPVGPYSPAQSPPPQDPRYSAYSQAPPQSYAQAPQQGYSEAPGQSYAPVQPPQSQTYYPPPQAQGSVAPPAELGAHHATPTQYQGRPVYEAA